MKDINKLRPLLATHQNVFETDKLSFLNRIRSEHSFQSVQDCLEYLNIIIANKPINPDNILPIYSEFDYSILKINIIDEAICSLIYETFISISRDNEDLLKYNLVHLEEFRFDLQYIIDEGISSVNTFFKPLFMIISLLISLYHNHNLEIDKEEDSKKQLARNYYLMMYYLYFYSPIKDNYFRSMQNFYYDMLYRHENWL